MIREENGEFYVYSEDGSRGFGCYKTKAEADERLKQIEAFKHMDQASGPRTDEERAMAHFGFTKPEWDALTPEQRAALIVDLLLRGSGVSQSDEEKTERVELRESVGVDTLEGKVWDVTIMRAGESLDRVHIFPSDVLKQAVKDGKFEGVKVFQFAFDGRYDHLSPSQEEKMLPKGLFGNLVGIIQQTYFDEAADAVKGKLHIVDEAVAQKLKTCYSLGGRLGLSIVAQAEKQIIMGAKGQRALVRGFESVQEVDIVTYPAAGGQLDRMVASIPNHGGSNVMNEKILAAIKKLAPSVIDPAKAYQSAEEVAALLQSALGVKASDTKQASALAMLYEVKALLDAGQADAASAKLDEALKSIEAEPVDEEPVTESDPEKPASEDVKQALSRIEKLEQSLAVRECGAILTSRLAQATALPEKAKASLVKRFSGRVFAEKELDEAIMDFSEVLGTGIRQSTIEVGADTLDKIRLGIDAMMGVELSDADKAKAMRFKSIRQAFTFCTGDSEVRGGSIDWSRLSGDVRQAMKTSDFPHLLGDSMNKRMAQEYRRRDADWRKLVVIRPIDNFNTQEINRWGGFADLATVAEDNSYLDIATPAEETPTYTAAKKGGLVGVTREMIKNDNLRMVQQIPTKLGHAAARTIFKGVIDKLMNWATAINDGVIYDTKVLYHADHANLVAAGLSYDNLLNAIVKLQSQTELTGADSLNIRPRYLCVPIALQPLAISLLNSTCKPGGTNDEANVASAYGIEPLVLPYTHANTTASFLVGDPSDADTIEVGFMDGKEEPELILQNGDSEGYTFTKDQWTWKVRFEYGMATADFRPFVGMLP